MGGRDLSFDMCHVWGGRCQAKEAWQMCEICSCKGWLKSRYGTLCARFGRICESSVGRLMVLSPVRFWVHGMFCGTSMYPVVIYRACVT